MRDCLIVDSHSPNHTRRLGQRLAKALKPGDVVLLSGPLGAGKTVFAQGLARGLGVTSGVSSKSFVLLGEYQGRLKMYHADLYRLTHPQEAADLGLEDYCSDGVLVVEWPERALDVFPQDRLVISFEVMDERRRRLTLKATGPRSKRLLAALCEKKWSSP